MTESIVHQRDVDGRGGGGNPAPQPEVAAHHRHLRIWLAAACCLLVLAAGGAGYWWLTRDLVSTDDAFVDGDAVAVAAQVVGGRVVALHIADNEQVAAGQLMIEIDPSDFEAALAQARANLAAAEADRRSAAADLDLTRSMTAADLALARSGVEAAQQFVQQAQAQADAAKAEAERMKLNLPRVEDLYRHQFNSAQQLDQARAAAQSTEAEYGAALKAVSTAQAQLGEAQARLLQAQTAPQQVALKEAALAHAQAEVQQTAAQVRTAELDLSYTRIVAPQAGRVTQRSVNVGDVVAPNQTLTFLTVGRPWVTANFKETQLAQMRPGQPVEIDVDTYSDRPLHGHVDSLQDGTGARFSLLPPENATGNYVKVVQRVPVKIVFDEPAEIDRFLALGMSVVPTVRVTQPTTAVDGAR
ncbi:MAG: HlyD family secretion protein [Geminicoccaceae bacterium]